MTTKTKGRKKLNRTNCKLCEKKIDGSSTTYCRSCTTKKNMEWRMKKYGTTSLRHVPELVEKLREQDREYQKNKRANMPGYKTKEYRLYRTKYPEKVRAQQMLNYALHHGKIKKKPCEKCGEEKVHAHHDDYKKPLVVRWLCPVHHKEAHVKVR